MKRPAWLARPPAAPVDLAAGPPPLRCTAELGVSLKTLASRTRVILSGELDLSNVRQFAAGLAEAEKPRPAELEIDLRALSFIDSSGLAELFAANRRSKEAGRRMTIVSGHSPIERVLDIARVEDVMDVVEQPAA